MGNQGWIKVHRQLQDCAIWLNEKSFDDRSAWIDLLLLANHSDKEILFNRKTITIKRGQYLTSVRKLAERWIWSKDKTLRYLRMLEELKMIIRESDNNRTLLTIVNYEVYQGLSDTDKDTDKYSSNDSIKDSSKDTDKDTDKPQTRIKELKNLKNEKNEKNNNIICSDPLERSEPPFIEILLNDGSSYPIYVDMVNQFKEIYPGVDVEKELRSMKGWSLSNPTKRKTKKGIMRFINSWLSKEQDKGSPNNQHTSAYMEAIKNRVDVVDSWV